MNQNRKFRTVANRGARRGASAVEFALVAPLFILLIFGGIELGRGVMVKHIIEEAARVGCRSVTLHNGTKQEALDVISTAMQNANISGYTVTFSPDPPTGLDQKTAVIVSISVPYSQVSWLPTRFMTGSTLIGACVMPAEDDVSVTKRQKETSKNKKKNKKAQY